MAKRVGISKRTRFRIFARDDFTCRYCGRQSDVVPLVVDHFIPVKEGGTNDDDNLMTACEPCNQGKAATIIPTAVATESERLAIAQERHEQIAAALAAKESAEMRREFRATVVELWCYFRKSETADKGTINVMVRYAERYGLDTLCRWVEMACNQTDGCLTDASVGQYISGIRRNLIERGDIAA
jgi:hypothetical protein